MQKVLSKKQIENDILNEGLLDSAKYLAAKYLPKYKVGGKIWGFGQNKAMKEMQAEILKVINSEAKGYILKLQKDIKEKNPDFPNNKDGKQFLSTVLEISQVYDTIMAAYNNKEINQTEADTYISNLRKYVTYIIDYQLHGDIYGTTNEEIELGEDKYLTEADMVFEKLFGEATIANPDDVNIKSVNKALDTDRLSRGGVADYNEFGTSRIATQESNRLPLALGAIGAVLTAAGWIGQSQWFIDYIEGLKEMDVKFTQDIIQRNIKIDPRGFSYTLQNNLPDNQAINLNFNQPIENLRKALEFYGNGNLQNGVNASSLFIDPSQRAASVTNLLEQLKDPSNRTIGDIFNTGEGTYGRAGTLFSQYGGAKAVIAKYFVNRMKTTIIKWGTGAALGSALIAAAPALTGLGIGAMVAGALVKLMRMKGLSSSRLKTLNLLLQSLRPVGKAGEQTQGGEGKPQDDKDQSQDSGEEQSQGDDGQQEPETIKTQAQLGAGETQKQIGGKPKPRELGTGKGSFSDKVDATDVEGEPVNQAQPEKQKQLPVGETTDVETLKNDLANFFKNVLTIKPKRRQAIAEAKEFDRLNIYKEDSVKQKQIEDFQKSAELLNLLAKNINLALRNPKISTDSKLENLLRKLQQNMHHRTIVDIKSLLKQNIKNKDLILRFITTYLTAIKQTRFGKILSYVQPDEQKKPIQLNEAIPSVGLNGEKNIQKFLTTFDTQFRIYLTDLYKLLVYLNKPATKKPAAPVQENIGQLEETKKKKTKYSKKASEFIGKEISHLKKDKKFPQEKAVAAAINIAKDKGMKVGSKKPKAKGK